MAYKALIFGTDKAYETMKPFIETAIKRGDFEIVARGKTENDNVDILPMWYILLDVMGLL